MHTKLRDGNYAMPTLPILGPATPISYSRDTIPGLTERAYSRLGTYSDFTGEDATGGSRQSPRCLTSFEIGSAL